MTTTLCSASLLRRSCFLPTLVLAGVLAGPCAPMSSTPALATDATGSITKEQAAQAALQALPGRVTDVTVEHKRGKEVYVIEIVADKDGEEADVLVDIESGKVIGMEH